jgi:arylsulfatase A-like enzyme
VGRVLQKIDDLALWDSSIVVFSSDHGTSLGEHNRTGKTNINDRDGRNWPIYPEVAHVPFLVAAPGLEGGRTVDTIQQPFDILPTLLELAGAEAIPPEPFHGRSFAPQLRGEAPAATRELAVSACQVRDKTSVTRPGATTPVVYTATRAYAPFGVDGGPELYDIEADPLAENNIIADAEGEAEALHEKLLGWLSDIDAPAGCLEAFR